MLLMLCSLQPPRPLCTAQGRRPDFAMREYGDWSHLSVFSRMALLRSLLDETTSREEVNQVVWKGLRLADESSSNLQYMPDVFTDSDLLARLEAQLPTEDDEDGPEQLASLDMLVEVLHGTELTRVLLDEADADFSVRRTVVRWLVTTQPSLALE
ncbi:hypothetical protein AB1Y20_017800 [Prymnesium parvum]|uniref:Protein HGH1 homolog n=1 Tax=Prymnesium parvum TaxID=97485 RepID=A0AB34JLN9_PRYPA